MQYKQRTQNNPFTIYSNFARLKARINNQTATKQNNQGQTNTMISQKTKLKVYLTDDDRTFIDKSAAHSLGLIDTRAIMLGNDQKIEITKKQLETLKTRPKIEIEYNKLESKKEIPEKPKIQVFVDNIDYYITLSAAYSLGLISVESFNTMQNDLYKISDNLLVFLKNKYNVEYSEINQNKKSR